ncbi:NADP-dependent malic enzyme-like [Macrosteles quadrilineatus]|uniref:NADP-dependent malic enzyme-like n=1 Tax=Macrosteles quadrilineatus TaxID=74068 RepID=UPI0023E217F0|nr:NADP-dependent malic enzyme-like [Macrosteles quadrilineatus]
MVIQGSNVCVPRPTVKNLVNEVSGCGKISIHLRRIEDQLDNCATIVKGITNDLDKYIYLRCLQHANEDLFYASLVSNLKVLLPVVYTPVVGLACQKYGLVPWQQHGLFISIEDTGKVEHILRNWPQKEIKAIVVTDGERILGLGDLGANGMGIPVGKLALYTAIGGVNPKYCLPVTLDVGTNNQELLKEGSPYVGHRKRRVSGDEYEQLVDEFMEAVIKVYGKNTLIQFEDFANQNAFKFLHKYRDQYTMFNDDIQGTAAVTVAGILAAVRFTGKTLEHSKVLFVGAGEAGVGIASLLVRTIGGDPAEARKRIYMKRSNRMIVKGDETSYPDDDDRRLFCHKVPEGAEIKDLAKIIQWLKPDILIGVSGAGRLFTKEVLEAMAEVSDTPIIMPLSNPTSQSECTAEEAYTHTKGKCLFASGSPFPPVNVQGQIRHPQQCNNAYIFPGVALAVTATQMTNVPEEVFLIAAKTLAYSCTNQEDFDQGSLFPSLDRIRACSLEIAVEVAKYAFDKDLSALPSKPEDIKEFILKHHYSPHHYFHHQSHHH